MTGKDSCISLRRESSGGYILGNQHFHLHSDSISLRIASQELVSFDFTEPSEEPCRLGNLSGTVYSDVSRNTNIDLRREMFLSDDGRISAIRFRVKNVSEADILFEGINAMEVTREESFSVGGAGIHKWRILRYPFHKNDIPSYFCPTTVDKDFEDAVFSRVGAVPGQGVLYNRLNVSTRTITSGPVLIIRNIAESDSPLLMLCTTGIEKHLMEMFLTTSQDRQRLKDFRIECSFDGVLMGPGDQVDTHWLLIATGSHESELLDTYTETVAGMYDLPPVKQPAPTVYCSWYFYTFNLTEDYLLEELAAIKEKNIPVDVFQIDDGWMDNYGSYQHDPVKFSHGMKYAAEKIRQAGMVPGIWVCPFVIEVDSPILQKYPNIIQRDADGKAIIYDTSINDCYIVDPTAEGAEQYFQEIFTRFKDWGYSYFKLDWLRAMYEFDTVRFRDPRVNRAMAYSMAMKTIRNVLGPECYITGCGGLSDPGNFGLVDAQRTCTDVRGVWEGPEGMSKSGAIVNIKQNLLRNYINRFYHSDPDAGKLRIRTEPFFDNERQCVGVYQSEGRYSDEEAFTICAHQYLCGGLVMISERFPELQESRLALLRHIVPSCTPPASILDFHSPVCPTMFLTEVTPKCSALGNWWTLAVANWEDYSVTKDVSVDQKDIPGELRRFAVFEFRTQEFLGLFDRKDKVQIEIPAHGIRVLRIVDWDGTSPKLIGTDLHITGGACEISEFASHKNQVVGKVSAAWSYPVTVTIGFPTESGGIRIEQDTIPIGEEQFSVGGGV